VLFASVPEYFKQELLFRQLTGFDFFNIPEQTGSKCDKAHIHSNQE
jgi:hypothetical protein